MYKIIFEDGEIFEGGKDLKNSGWNDMPDKPIESIEYTLLGRTLVLENYESYNHHVMVANILFANLSGIIRVIIEARKKDIVTRFTFDLVKKEYSIIEVPYVENATTGWKKGIADLNPTYRVI
jgi:hypothetical protein